MGQYSEKTEQIASQQYTRQPKVAGRDYNFEWSGELFDGMQVRFTKEYIEIFSTADHADEVVAKFSGSFGDELFFGLTTAHMEEFVSKIRPDIVVEIKKTLVG